MLHLHDSDYDLKLANNHASIYIWILYHSDVQNILDPSLTVIREVLLNDASNCSRWILYLFFINYIVTILLCYWIILKYIIVFLHY